MSSDSMRSLRLLITQHLSNFNCRRRRKNSQGLRIFRGAKNLLLRSIMSFWATPPFAGTLSCHDQKRVTPSAFQWVRMSVVESSGMASISSLHFH
ncbi:hypothetical protein CEXT_385291 [Caerostris extrusa]|uniref:Uncharacterized protein n=1 Tax=Caerostris extrusa TaxID=172846 RepID=A0AAV4RM37_CAEEX|nr:hypothetical protein CEXT_385291 [Caerostris extrusa]